ncbi:LysM peptidoglycan-binding domain-containing protein [Spirosoma agri]|uniref:LysM peptidoglycan-binding domain-containing protein n=1 Tax=Spirosoma agri TaxID=1987381 RepID=A0A6M0IC08_9BACT|nr:LysM peptidoglycan-binding domain-containing protein [Spirosoma agri]NEU65618.1 LysM peptidoglycan-binding domain-containing protein [Spirosoma agri]
MPYDIDFAGVSVHLTQPGRLQVQQEVQQLYTNRAGIQTDMNTLRQLTPLLKPLFTEVDLPDDFRYAALPFTNNDTTGFWALSQAHARDLKLRIDQTVDERYHPIVSTEAVLVNISQLQKTQGNYVLALLQYLKGEINPPAPERIDPSYILLKPNSPPLIWKILARKLVFEHEEPTYRPSVSYMLFEYQNGEGKALQTIADRLRVTEERVKPFNQWLKTTVVPTGKEYSVFVQVTPDEFALVRSIAESGMETAVVRRMDVGFPILTKVDEQAEGLRALAIYYKINNRRGVQAQNCDNFITLAFYGNITINAFLNFNDLSINDIARPGEIYYLERKAKRAKVPFHVVQKNQTLREVASIYGVQLKSLLRFNDITATQRVQTGRVLWLQAKRPANRPAEYRQLPVDEQKQFTSPEPVIAEKKGLEPSPSSLPEQKPAVITSSPVTDNKAALISPKTPDDSSARSLDEDLLAVSDSISHVDTAQHEVIEAIKLHVVTPGQTYFAIARLYGVTVKQLYTWNNLSERIPLKVGQELIIDVTEKQRIAREKQRVVSAKPVVKKQPGRGNLVNLFVVSPVKEAIYYTVKAGQTLYRVALINKVRVEDLMRWNNLPNYVIEIGQKLLIRK